MKKLIFLLIIFGLFIECSLLCSCGHSVQSNSKGIGIDLSWNGDSYIPNLRLGYWDATCAVVRGNTNYTTTSSSGGSIVGSGGIQTTTQMVTGVQLNQANLRDVLASPNLSDQAKIEIIKYTMGAKIPKVYPTYSRTSVSVGGTGETIPQVDTIYANVNNIMSKSSDIAKTLTPVIADKITKTQTIKTQTKQQQKKVNQDKTQKQQIKTQTKQQQKKIDQDKTQNIILNELTNTIKNLQNFFLKYFFNIFFISIILNIVLLFVLILIIILCVRKK